MSRLEGIIPALESAHGLAHAMKLAPTLSKDTTILINMSGRGDKDLDYVCDKYGENMASERKAYLLVHQPTTKISLVVEL